MFGGPPNTAASEEYNGVAWSAGGTASIARRGGGGSNGAGTQDNALYFGGSPGAPATGSTSTEGYDGTAWSTRPSLSTARGYAAGAGSAVAALAFGNYPAAAPTEEFTGQTTALNVKTITTS